MMSSTSFHLSWGLDREKKMGFFQFFPQPKVLLTSIAWLGNCILSFALNLCRFSSGQGFCN
jgi:hypothetical protein